MEDYDSDHLDCMDENYLDFPDYQVSAFGSTQFSRSDHDNISQ